MPGERAPENAAVWQPRPWQALVVRATIAIGPVLLAAAGSLVLGRMVVYPDDGALQAGWWLGLMVATSAGLLVFDRAARRFLPLASLLSLTLIFPDRAPSRFRVALRSGSTRNLQRLITEAQHDEVPPDAARAAEWVLGLVSALSYHDRATRGHSERVRAYTDMIAEEMGLDEDRRNRLRWAALLHDVGKLRTPREVLTKAGAPTDAEWELLKRHPVDGLQLCWPLQQWLGDALGAVVHHHERVDGRGYPHGVSGMHLGWAARIVTVADCYDVMTSVRSYKKAMPAAAARAELARCAGTQFDPVVVRAFLNVSLGRTRFVAGPLAALVNLPFVGGAVSATTTATTAALPATVATVASGALLSGAVVAVAPPEPVRAWAATVGASADPLPSAGTTVTSAPAGRPPVTVRVPDGAPPPAPPSAGAAGGPLAPAASAARIPVGTAPVGAESAGSAATAPSTTTGTTGPGTTGPGTTGPGTSGPAATVAPTGPATTGPGTAPAPRVATSGPATTVATSGPATTVVPASPTTSTSTTSTTPTTRVPSGSVPFTGGAVALAGAGWNDGDLVFNAPQGSALTKARYGSAGLEATFEVSVDGGDAKRGPHGMAFAFVPADRVGRVGAGGSGLGWGGLGGIAIGFLVAPMSGKPAVVVARQYESGKGLIVSSQAQIPASKFEVKVTFSASKRVRVSIDGKQVLDVTVAELPSEGSVGFTASVGSSTAIRIDDVKIRAGAAPGAAPDTAPAKPSTTSTTAPAKPVLVEHE